ncbi:ATP-binding cassette domain-containing protein [Afifella marina]|uniref:Putative thiamine transport system ATP-binding protein n=1 Tax=Afifella marina DSM 2698 TaxID=1120955 RepID=A0A1G5M4A4_AFIMA|nr:ATP-binding cassette domain-containing protein [Afifella marina]MBK1622996.1 ABC transporter ATP-binding protein [Afifella marina DSM 2698]MBK1625990.1 ABC transporter ATP-binding protein [Afifella marina]MBK5917814.1 ABC transporter ATP-binding protein [Afifella marina]RAI18241.1 ABC transporter ATP-binding protein [Afifella marina DSM 2698]SCZ20013.1 putative thiamine transport system ATP-binding protein [Afifella marina DSM 2698]
MTSAPEATDALTLSQVRISLAGRLLLSVDKTIRPGEVLTVMGPSGSGKSTLLAFAAGFLDPIFAVEGRVLLAGEDVTRRPAEARQMGLLFQDPLLFPHLSVAGNLLFGLRPGSSREARQDTVSAALAEVGLEGMEGRDPATLSGGQRARIALLRTLLSRPRALLLDEPFSKLDVALRDQMRRLVFDEAGKRNLPVLLVTHDRQDAEAAGGPVIELGGTSDE